MCDTPLGGGMNVAAAPSGRGDGKWGIDASRPSRSLNITAAGSSEIASPSAASPADACPDADSITANVSGSSFTATDGVE